MKPSPPACVDFPDGSDGKESAYNAGDPGSIPGWGSSPGEGNGNPFQYSCLENPVDRGAWCPPQSVELQSRTKLSDFHFTSVYMPISNSRALWVLNSKSPQVLKHMHAYISRLPMNTLRSPSRSWSCH